jgi:hypothetical protein
VWRLSPLRWVLYPARAAPVLWLRRKPHCELQGLIQVEGREGGSCKESTRVYPKKRRHRPPCCPESSAGRSLCRADGPGRGLESRRPSGACCQGYHHHSTPTPKSYPQPVTEAPGQPNVTATRTTTRPQKPEPKSIASPKPAAEKSKKKAARECQNRGCQSHNPRTGGTHPTLLPTRRYL